MSSLGKIVISCCLLYATPAFCWWETGHRTVARLAAAHLTAAVRFRVAQILNVPDTPDAVADALAVASTWPDETKAQTKTGDWHYIDLALQDEKSDIPERCKDDKCVTARIRLFATQLSRHDSNRPINDLDALRYLVHFVGDIHQPLHAVSNADLGGNCEHVDPPVDTAKNLHAVWDGAIVNAVNPSDRELAADLDRNLHSFLPNCSPIWPSATRTTGLGNPISWPSRKPVRRTSSVSSTEPWYIAGILNHPLPRPLSGLLDPHGHLIGR